MPCRRPCCSNACQLPPWTTGAHGHKPSNNRALSKPLVAVMALCVAATRNMLTCCLHTPPEASPKVEAPEGPPLAALAIRPPEPRRVLSGSHEGASTACYSLWPRQNSECAGPRKAFTCSLCGPTAGGEGSRQCRLRRGLHFSPFRRAPEASPKVEAPEGPPLAALAIRPPDPRRTGSVVRRTCPVEDVNTSQVHMCRLPRDLHVHASRGDVLACRSKVCACAKQWAAGAETTIIPGGCTVRATSALPGVRNLRAGPESAQSTENCPDFGCFNLIRLRPHSAKSQDKSFFSKLSSKRGDLS